MAGGVPSAWIVDELFGQSRPPADVRVATTELNYPAMPPTTDTSPDAPTVKPASVGAPIAARPDVLARSVGPVGPGLFPRFALRGFKQVRPPLFPSGQPTA